MTFAHLTNAALGRRRSAPWPRPLRLLTALGWTALAALLWTGAALLYALTH